MNLIGKDGRLPPTIVGLIIILAFILGNVTGWIAHMNWIHRGEAAQIIEDMEVGDEIKEEEEEKLNLLDSTINEVYTDERFKTDEHLNSSNPEYVRSLRDSIRDEEF